MQEYYTFGESTWDLVLFIGTGALGPLGSLQTCVLAIVNVLMQVIFVGIAVFNFLDPDITEEKTVQEKTSPKIRWPNMFEFVQLSKESLTSRVCAVDKSLHIAGLQVDMVENIRKYLNTNQTGLIRELFSGQVLCLVALICWYLMEVSHALALHRGVAAVPRGKTEIATRENPFTQVTYYRLVKVARRRKLASFLLLIYRPPGSEKGRAEVVGGVPLFAAVILIYVGTFFLVYTVNVTELILNAVALGIILDIDDLLFDALATTPGRHLVHQLDPLPMPSFPRFRGADAKSTTMTFLIPGLTMLIYVTMVSPFVDTLVKVEDTFCGGNQGFVWSVDKRSVILLAPTEGGGLENQTETIQTAALSEALDLENIEDPRGAEYGVWLRGVSLVTDWESLSLDELVTQSNPDCEDLANEVPLLNYLRDALGNSSINSCADAEPFCHSLTKMPSWETWLGRPRGDDPFDKDKEGLDGGMGYATRMYCPVTCGCHIPGGAYTYIQGCPYGENKPCWNAKTFQDFREAGLCTEKTPQESVPGSQGE
eukprot:g20771.t1